jgi:heat-inducible transcriptional repressor
MAAIDKRSSERSGVGDNAPSPLRSERLSERKAKILRALVHQYVRTGEPVGSEAIATAANLGVSSATVRNDLAALEEMGYLTQPHTSAGRIPTDAGYRHYVDALPPRTRLRDPERREIVHFFSEALADVDEILRGTTHLLSRLTSYASLALAPSREIGSIARLELVNIGSAALLLVVFDTGLVDKRMLELPPEATEEHLDRISRGLWERYRAWTVPAARARVADESRTASEPERTILARVAVELGSIEEAAGGGGEHVFLGGAANIATEEAFERRETLRQIFEALERETEILGLLRQASTQPVAVTIGHESPVTGMWEASVVTAPYGPAGDHALGTIGVVGPTRMDYGAAIAAVRAVAERLSAAVEALSG